MDRDWEKECSALGGLFQCIVNDLKTGYPVWEDFAQKATKMHFHLKAVATAVNCFLDSLQRVADMAAGAKGATRDIGTTLTRICMRHRSIENRLKTFTSALLDRLVLPLHEKLDDWRRTAITLDKEHARAYKKTKSEIKKRAVDGAGVQKKVRKGESSARRFVDSAAREPDDLRFILLQTQQQAVRRALTEQRSQFCMFVSWFKPFLDGELSLLNEIDQLQEVAELLYKHAADPFTLPPSSEAVIIDAKGLEHSWCFRTPPSSPGGSSSGSRKSSFSSVTSCLPSPNLNPQLRSATPSTALVNSLFSSGCWRDSCISSEEALYRLMRQQVGSSEENDAASDGQSTPSPPLSVVTCPEMSPIGGAIRTRPPIHHPLNAISAHCSQSSNGSSRPTLSFAAPVSADSLKGTLKSKRSSSQEPGAQRPPLPHLRRLPVSGSNATPPIPDFNLIRRNQIVPQPIYANIQELANAGGIRTHPRDERPRRPLSFASSDESTAFLSIALGGAGRECLLAAGSSEAYSTTPTAKAFSVAERKQSMRSQAPPPPPMRRSSSITTATPPTPVADFVHSDDNDTVVTDPSPSWLSAAPPGPADDEQILLDHHRGGGGGDRARSEPPIPEHSVCYPCRRLPYAGRQRVSQR